MLGPGQRPRSPRECPRHPPRLAPRRWRQQQTHRLRRARVRAWPPPPPPALATAGCPPAGAADAGRRSRQSAHHPGPARLGGQALNDRGRASKTNPVLINLKSHSKGLAGRVDGRMLGGAHAAGHAAKGGLRQQQSGRTAKPPRMDLPNMWEACLGRGQDQRCGNKGRGPRRAQTCSRIDNPKAFFRVRSTQL